MPRSPRPAERWPATAARLRRRRWKLLALSSAIGAVVFVLTKSAFRPGQTLRHGAVAAVAGLIIGALAAPEFDPKLFPAPALWQALIGAVGGGLLALLLGAPAGSVTAAVVGGAGLGVLARYWLEHL